MKYKTLLLAILLFNTVFSQTKLIQELDKNIIEIKTISPDSSFDDINKLLPILKDKKIVALGEATHGTHEFFVYKHRLIKLLTKQANFKIIIIEGDFTGSQIMNDYVLYGKGTIKDALFGVGYGIWMTQEFVDMIEWVRKYNSNKELKDKIKFYGCDMNYPSLAAKKINQFLKQNDKSSILIEKGLNWVINRKYLDTDFRSKEDSTKLFIKALDSAFESIENKTNNDFKLVEHSKRIINQIMEMIFASSSERVLLRDIFIAENIEWIYNFENQQKAIFWAHNEHIANNNNKKEQKPTGYYLKKKYGNDYYSFGFGFYKGENRTYNRKERKWVVNSIPNVSVKKSTDAIFNNCLYPNLILDFNSVRKNRIITTFLNTNLYHRCIGAKYYPENNKSRNYKKSKLIDSFDGMIFFRETNASTMMWEE